MDWLQRMNSAMNYIEENLTGDIDFEQAAQAALCSNYHFQRMFGFITGVPLAEYIRRRRLTLAAFELQNSGVCIIDLALKYGYDSRESFSRAFLKLHGVSPSSARRRGEYLKAYPRISFHISMKGDTEMNYKIVEKDAFELIGKGIVVDAETVGQKAGEFWKNSKTYGTKAAMQSLSGNALSYGVTCYKEFADNTWTYHIAYENGQHLAEVPPEFEIMKIPAHTWVVFSSTAPLHEAIKELWSRSYSEWFPTSGYTPLSGPEMEVYHSDRFELWIPLKV